MMRKRARGANDNDIFSLTIKVFLPVVGSVLLLLLGILKSHSTMIKVQGNLDMQYQPNYYTNYHNHYYGGNDDTTSSSSSKRKDQEQTYQYYDIVQQRFLQTNSSKYIWNGNQFIPPSGIPMFSPLDFLTYFSKRNTLFIGDSTGRRSYGTLYGIMNSSDLNNVHVNDIDGKHVIDFNKGRSSQEDKYFCTNHDRYMYPGANHFKNFIDTNFQYFCRDLPTVKGINASSSAADDNDHEQQHSNIKNIFPEGTLQRVLRPGIKSEDEDNNKKGKFDFVKAECFGHVYQYLDFNNNNQTISHSEEKTASHQLLLKATKAISNAIQKEYDLIVVSSGIWEGTRLDICDHSTTASKLLSETGITATRSNNHNNNNSVQNVMKKKLHVLLNTLKKSSSSSLQIVYRTPGFQSDGVGHNMMVDIINHSKDYFARINSSNGGGNDKNTTTSHDMILVDWVVLYQNEVMTTIES